MGKKTKASNLGRSLIRDRFNHGGRRTVDNNSMVRFTFILSNIVVVVVISFVYTKTCRIL